jgi:signal transduction histidine kinase
LNRITSETVELLRTVLRRQIELSVQLEIEPLPVFVDAVELRQVIILLALNAARPMQAKGKIGFRTSRQREAVVLRQFHGTVPRPPSLCLTITDDAATLAVGQNSSLLDPFADAITRDFAPCFHMAKQFVEKHDGAVSLRTEKGEGTVIELWLPQADFTEGENK